MSRFRPSPALVIAFIALVVSIGGTSYAAIKLPANSVGAKQLKKGAVERAKIKNGAIDATKLAADSIGAASINESGLGKVPSAAQADHASLSGGLDRVTYKSVQGSIPKAIDANTQGLATLDISCAAGQQPTGGGIRLGDVTSELLVDASVIPSGYELRVLNFDTTAAHDFTGTVICIGAAATG
jgi:hypothetical protein